MAHQLAQHAGLRFEQPVTGGGAWHGQRGGSRPKEEPSLGLRPSLKMRTPERMRAVGLPSSPNRNIAQPNDVDPKSNANRYALISPFVTSGIPKGICNRLVYNRNHSITGICALDANKLKDAPNGKPRMRGFRLLVKFTLALIYQAQAASNLIALPTRKRPAPSDPAFRVRSR